MKSLIDTISVFVILAALTSCQQSNKKNLSLYQQIGGKPVVLNMTTKLVDRLFNNQEIAFLFKDSDRNDLIEHISSQICLETGGQCLYKGRTMQEVHSGLDIRYSEFDVFVQEFIAAMEDVDIPFTIQNRILALFAVMRDDVSNQ